MNPSYPFGSVLKVTRDDTPEALDAHLALMKQYGHNTVVIWPAAFYWEEKTPDYPFATGKLILRLAQKHGLSVIMELAGQITVFEAIPDFRMKDEYLPVDRNGNLIHSQSSYGFLNYFHPEVDAAICGFYRQAAEAYRDFPALYGWDIFNETMFTSFDRWTLEAFRTWLKEKYGTIERLCEVWERTYTDFLQIGFEEWMWMSIMPIADYNAFHKESVGIILRRWRKALLEVDPLHMTVADNIHSGIAPTASYDRPQDDFIVKEAAGELGMSFYPKQVGGTRTPVQRWEVFDGFMASAGREGFFVSEMQTHIQAMFNEATCVRPWELTEWCMEAYAAGAKGLIFWMWRPFITGLQTGGRGLVDYKGRPTVRLETAQKLSDIMTSLGALTPLRAKAGILFDGLSDDFQRMFCRAYGVDKNIYVQSLFGLYHAMYDAGVRCDFLRLDELEKYPVVFLSNQIVCGPDTAAALKAYVENGGTLVIDGKFGTVDRTAKLLSELPGGDFAPYVGEEVMDSDYEALAFPYDGLTVNGFHGRDLCEVKGAEVTARFVDGYPAVIEKKTGHGKVVTINTFLWYGYAKTADGSVRAFAQKLADSLGLRQSEAAEGVKVRLARSAEKDVIFAFNYADHPVESTVRADFGEKRYEETVRLDAHEVRLIVR